MAIAKGKLQKNIKSYFLNGSAIKYILGQVGLAGPSGHWVGTYIHSFIHLFQYS